ncbi:hypothetical protein ElyMa_002035400 [Elysia marginata]|uniref:Uncharacterized protein n=1 Tax=Elysia marginata TaxID=1093978 RepID=A0AAV4F7J6_9GAST|nr:hypothetical protein ElyMa_002035400 [Elysia marginata]
MVKTTGVAKRTAQRAAQAHGEKSMRKVGGGKSEEAFRPLVTADHCLTNYQGVFHLTAHGNQASKPSVPALSPWRQPFCTCNTNAIEDAKLHS